MIRFFKIRNFRSIKETLSLSFVATGISGFEKTNIIKEDGERILKNLLLYGHNASGKSNILSAMVFYRWLIINSATRLQSNSEIDIDPFLLDAKTEGKPSFFEMGFTINSTKYRYGFEVDRKTVHKEWLLESKKTKEYPVFLRMGDEYEIDQRRFPGASGVEQRTRSNALFMSVCAQWNVKKAEEISNWFSSIYTVHGLMDKRYREETIDMLKSKKFAHLVNQLIQKADLGVTSVKVQNIKLEDIIAGAPEELKGNLRQELSNKDHNAVLMFHDKINEKGQKENIPFLLEKHESEGTKKFFNLIGIYLKSILENKILLIDEFDARLHTLLTKAILSLFNSNKFASKSQLIAACHDTALLDKRILRRDQIYFVEKSEAGATTVTSLVEYKVRKETPYDKNYLNGKYGGIGMVQEMQEIFNK